MRESSDVTADDVYSGCGSAVIGSRGHCTNSGANCRCFHAFNVTDGYTRLRKFHCVPLTYNEVAGTLTATDCSILQAHEVITYRYLSVNTCACRHIGDESS